MLSHLKLLFEHLSQALPRFQTFEVINQFAQKKKINTIINTIEFPHLNLFILHNIHINYAEQLLCQSRLIERVIRDDPLLIIIYQNQQQTRDNCSKVKTLPIVELWLEPISIHLNFFPCLHSEIVEEC
ncbi:unnamed protein product [Rotaria sordida]|uniref:Uncharacterized protein n=1 Tax=Rotaria sordida TaxID=392033 RepID=A0A814XG48_9BILA|nr:unnamed protein product [Rotaria sordida]CAF3932610.1 unnamed protein product [Rotaria sordida]